MTGSRTASIPDVTGQSLAQLVTLTGRTALVTGAAMGLGRAIAERLTEAGANLVLGDIARDAVHTAAEELSKRHGIEAIGVAMDMRDPAAIAAAVEAAVTRFGGIDILVNNAGIYPLSPVVDMPDAQWHEVIAINLSGVFFACREAARIMVRQGRGGVVVSISSTSGVNGGGVSIPHYAASKHGVIGLTKQMALEFAPHAIRFLAVAPNVIVTEGVRHAKAEAVAAAGFELEVESSLLGRAGVPDDVARAVLFAASDMAMFMTGSTLFVDAGSTARG